MENDNSVIYGLEFQARALAAQVAETEKIRFLIGTQSLKQVNNQIHLVEFNEETSVLKTTVYQHFQGEIWKLTASPTHPQRIATCYNTFNKENMCCMKTAILQFPETENPNEIENLEVITKFNTEKYGFEVKTSEFHPNDPNKLMSVMENNIVLWDTSDSEAKSVTNIQLDGKNSPKFTTGKWNPHQNCNQAWFDLRTKTKRKASQFRSLRNKTGGGSPPTGLTDLDEKIVSIMTEEAVFGLEAASGVVLESEEPFPIVPSPSTPSSSRQELLVEPIPSASSVVILHDHDYMYAEFATATETHIKTYDIRAGSLAWHIDSSHGQLVRDMDFNLNKQYHLATCGDDGFVKIWDFRQPSQPVYSRSDHSHWIWCVRINPFHDQLLLTASSDARVLLSSASSVSSENVELCVDNDGENADATESKQIIPDGPLQWCEHEDSVYCVEWSPAEPWTFASLSYDGRLLLTRVRRSYKYQILL